MEALPEALLGPAVPLFALEEIGRPLQRPLLQELYAHCELPVQAALKFPHLGIRPELLA
jgi:hypothetical protein